MKRRTLFEGTGGGGINPSEAVAMDVVFYDGHNIVIRKQEDWKDEETPIGIVVVPGTHDRYGDGSCGVMSLVEMDYNHPETGVPVTSADQTDSVTMYDGGGRSTDYIGNSIFSTDTSLHELSGGDTGNNNRIPFQRSNASDICYVQSGGLNWPYLFSPFSTANYNATNTGNVNTSYINTNGYVAATSGKAGCDFNGIRNTVALYVKTRASTQWTDTVVPNTGYNTSITPAAACCGRFKTVGTNSFYETYNNITNNYLGYGTVSSTMPNRGVWYFPAAGELCYIPSKWVSFNNTILALNQKYGNVGTKLKKDNINYVSSSENTFKGAGFFSVGPMSSSVNIGGGLKSRSYGVRAFMRI